MKPAGTAEETTAGAYTEADSKTLTQLRADHPGHHIWRAVRRDGNPGDWIATLHDRRAGISPTLICDYPGQLRDALAEERDRAMRKYDGGSNA